MRELCTVALYGVTHGCIRSAAWCQPVPSSAASFPLIFRGCSVTPKKPPALLTPSHCLLLRRPKLAHRGKPRFKGRGIRSRRPIRAVAQGCGHLPSALPTLYHCITNTQMERKVHTAQRAAPWVITKRACVCHKMRYNLTSTLDASSAPSSPIATHPPSYPKVSIILTSNPRI